MKAADFIYHRAASVAEALSLLDDYNGEARILAGGQSLVPMMNMRLWRPAALIDINGIPELATFETRGEDIVVGAMVRYATIEKREFFTEYLPLIAKLVHHIGDRQVRNRGTIGGSLVQGDPTSEMALGCLALGAKVRVISAGGIREIPMDEFYHGSYAAALDAGEVLKEIIFPKHPSHHAFRELCRRHNDFAVLSVAACANRSSEGRWHNVSLGLGGVHETPILAKNAATGLEGLSLSDDDIATATEAALQDISPNSDMRASEDYRRYLVSIYVPLVLRDLRDSPKNPMTAI
jgi:aerobic carbon-monoxide dehydrogenase medium subunit